MQIKCKVLHQIEEGKKLVSRLDMRGEGGGGGGGGGGGERERERRRMLWIISLLLCVVYFTPTPVAGLTN